MKIGVIGAGGVGGYFGAKMVSSGYDVVFLARGENMKALKKNGITVKSFLGNFHVERVHVSDRYETLADCNLIIMATKAWQVAEIAANIKPVIGEHAVVLPLQNGVLAFEEISAALGKQRVLGGLCRIMSKIESPGVIIHNGIEPSIIFGEMDNKKSLRTMEILDLFEKSGIHARIAGDIAAELWKKFINICVGGLLAVTRCTYGEARQIKETREMMVTLMEEIYTLSRQTGIHIDHSFVQKTMEFVDAFPFDSTASLTRDVWEGKPSEIEYQNGSVVRLGEKYGIPTPVNRYIYYSILPMEKRARKSAGNP